MMTHKAASNIFTEARNQRKLGLRYHFPMGFLGVFNGFHSPKMTLLPIAALERAISPILQYETVHIRSCFEKVKSASAKAGGLKRNHECWPLIRKVQVEGEKHV
jgi:hypothetical protein